MRTHLTAAVAAFLFTVFPALADDTFNVNISNGEMAMLLLTVTDMNYPTPKTVYNGSINDGQEISVYINGQSGGNGHITWTAQTADRQKCGNGEETSLSSGNNVKVSTPSSC